MKRLLMQMMVLLILAVPISANAGSSLQTHIELNKLTKMMDENNSYQEKRGQYYQDVISDNKGTQAAAETAELIAAQKQQAGGDRREGEQQKKAADVNSYGYIGDPDAGLQWIPAPSYAVSWNQANEYVQKLNVTGEGWRLPTKDELRDLCWKASSIGKKEAFINNGLFVWSSELSKDPSIAAGVLFDSCRDSAGLRTDAFKYNRVLAVRSRK